MGVSRDTRVLNLIVGLADSPHPLTATDISRRVPGYNEGNDQAMKKRLQRDRADLRTAGINIVQVQSPHNGAEPGYELQIDTASTQDIHLEPAEYQAVSLAADMWRGTSLYSHAQCGLAKIAAQHTRRHKTRGRQADQLTVDLSTAPPTLGAFAAAVKNRTTVSFIYRAPGKAPTKRTLQPHHIVWQRSAWYVAGHDTDRDAHRTFKLLRIVGAVKNLTALGQFAPPATPARVNIPHDADPSDLDVSITTHWDCSADSAHQLKAVANSPSDATTVTLTCNSPREAEQAAIQFVQDATLTGPPELVSWLDTQLHLAQTRLVGSDNHEPLMPDTDVTALLKPLTITRRESQTGPARIVRALSLATYLHNNEGITLEELAAHFQVPVTTTTSDLELIRECSSFPHTPDVSVDAHWDYGAVSLHNAEPLQQHLTLTDTESHALVTGLQLLTHIETLAEPARSAATKLGATTPADHTHITADVDQNQTSSAQHHGPVIDDAIYANRQITLTYTSESGTSTRKVDPWQRKLLDGRWYLEGWCAERNGPRTFRLDRISSLNLLPSQREHHQESTSRYAATSQSDYALLSIRPDLLPTVEKHGAVTVSNDSPIPGDVLVGIGYFTHAWLARLALSHAETLHIIGPESARKAVSDLLGTYRFISN